MRGLVLLLDLSDVLIHGMYDMDQVLHHRFGRELAEKSNNRHEEIYGTYLMELLRGKMTEDEYWELFLSKGEWPDWVTKKIFKSALSENLRKRVNYTDSVLKRICGYTDSVTKKVIMEKPTIVLASDQIRERIPEVQHEHQDIFKLFSEQFWSPDLGMVKTDKGFFSSVLSQLDLEPGARNVIFVDDSGPNLQAARDAGIQWTIKFNNSALLEIALEGQGIMFEKATKLTETYAQKAAMAT